MPYDQDHSRKDILDSLLFNAERIWNSFFGLLPFPGCNSNDAKFGIRLGDLKYSKEILLRLAEQGPDFNQRAKLITDYLVSCNPHLEKTIRRMDLQTKRLFYKRLSDDLQFDWCLDNYPEIELADSHMRPGLSGLHISDSVARDKINNKYVAPPLGALLLFLLWNSESKGDPNSAANLFKKAPPLDDSRPPLNDAAAFGLQASGINYAAQTFFYGTHESHETYQQQKSKEQAKKTARLLQRNVEKVVSEHKESIVLPRDKGKGTIKCINIESANSPSVETSEALRKIRSGETGCSSICGTQSDTAVDQCLKNSRKKFSIKDNNQCEDAGPFRSEEALKSRYFDEARQGVYEHERTWRRDQKLDPLFNKQCKEPLEGNFNPWPGSSIDKTVERGLHKKFASNGENFNKGCKLESFPGPALDKEQSEISFDQLPYLTCEDNQKVGISAQDIFAQQPYDPDQQTISGEALNSMLQELSRSILDSDEDCPEFE